MPGVDAGIVVNPEGSTQQAEGSIMMGLGYVLTEELRPIQLDPQGGGEPAIVPMGGAIANAVFDATGKRVLRLPITQGADAPPGLSGPDLPGSRFPQPNGQT